MHSSSPIATILFLQLYSRIPPPSQVKGQVHGAGQRSARFPDPTPAHEREAGVEFEKEFLDKECRQYRWAVLSQVFSSQAVPNFFCAISAQLVSKLPSPHCKRDRKHDADLILNFPLSFLSRADTMSCRWGSFLPSQFKEVSR